MTGLAGPVVDVAQRDNITFQAVPESEDRSMRPEARMSQGLRRLQRVEGANRRHCPTSVFGKMHVTVRISELILFV